MFDERNRRISICLPFSLIFPTSLEGYHAGTLKDGAVNCLNERERNLSIKKITQFELINYFSKYLYHRYDWADSWNYDPKILKAPVTPVDTCWSPKCNNCPKCNKVLNVITFGPKCNKVLNVITFSPKCNKPLMQSFNSCSALLLWRTSTLIC